MTTLETFDLGTATVHADRERRARPVLAWAAAGVAFSVAAVALVVAWVLSGDAQATPSGATPVPGWMTVSARVWEGLVIVCTVTVVYLKVIRPWRAHRALSFDGLFLLALASTFWQDPLLNYVQTQGTYNSVFVNLGSWAARTPGWISPNANRYPTPILGLLPIYLCGLISLCMAANWVMRTAKSRYPRLGRSGLILICFGFIAVADLIFEAMFFTRFGFFVYPSAISWLTLFHGHYYQFPVYEAVCAGALFGSFACIRYFRDDRGLSFAERGLERVVVATRMRTWLRFFALSGLCNVCFIVFFNVPMNFFGLHASGWPQDITDRSYLTNGFCGSGTTYACPGPGTPIPRRNSAHLTPDGGLEPGSH
jgi:hypothetical protein